MQKAVTNLQLVTRKDTNINQNCPPEEPTNIGFSFPVEERLKNRKCIDRLFKSGRKITTASIKAVFYLSNEADDTSTLKVAFAVPKKAIRKSNKRNTLKRRMRESYRLHRQPLKAFLENKSHYLEVIFIFLGKEILSYQVIEKDILYCLEKLKGEIH